MKTITVGTSREYSVKIGTDLLPMLGSEVANIVQGRSAAIISDSHVWPIYGEYAANSLENAGFSVCYYVITAGEDSKNGETYLQLLSFLAENQITRADCVIALGGGVVGDLAGFAAATYLRGVSYVQVPTTLLAMVDSSVGGKTAIDLPAGKNLAGAFYQPSLVLCDIQMLNTLPNDVFMDGCAEVIKYGIIYDEALFSKLERQGPQFDREDVIAQCIQMKADVVTLDEYDTGARQMLNLGHTIGHGIEKESRYTISHGKAVSIGISIVSRSCAALGLCSEDDCQRIIKLLQEFCLPTSTQVSHTVIAEAALADKKRSRNTIGLIVPATIGCCKQYICPISELDSFIKAGM